MHKIILRPASEIDGDLLLGWRNDPLVFKHFKNPHPIARKEHNEWLKTLIKKSDSKLLVARDQLSAKDVGMIRFDFLLNSATVSIHIDSALFGQGYGVSILTIGEHWISENYSEICWLTAVVMNANTASKKLFEKCGFRLKGVSEGQFHYEKKIGF